MASLDKALPMLTLMADRIRTHLGSDGVPVRLAEKSLGMIISSPVYGSFSIVHPPKIALGLFKTARLPTIS